MAVVTKDGCPSGQYRATTAMTATCFTGGKSHAFAWIYCRSFFVQHSDTTPWWHMRSRAGVPSTRRCCALCCNLLPASRALASARMLAPQVALSWSAAPEGGVSRHVLGPVVKPVAATSSDSHMSGFAGRGRSTFLPTRRHGVRHTPCHASRLAGESAGSVLRPAAHQRSWQGCNCQQQETRYGDHRPSRKRTRRCGNACGGAGAGRTGGLRGVHEWNECGVEACAS